MRAFNKTVTAFLACGFCCAALFAESMEMPEMPKMPEISTSAEVTMPSLNGTFYKPSVPKPVQPPKSPDEKAAGENTPANETILTDATTTDDIFATLLNNSSTLTARDISTLYDSGLFTDVSSLGTSALTGYSQDATTNLLLQQILTNLNEMKAEQKNVTVAEQEVLSTTQADRQTFKKREPNILRFKINGYDIKDSLTTVFFSEPEADGTFLLTADRKYYADHKNRSETFYILFKAVKNSGSYVSYQVQPSIVQDYKNENSFIYRFAGLKGLTAEKTGNMVVLHCSDGLNVDLLVNIDK